MPIEAAGYRFRDVTLDGTLTQVTNTIEDGSAFVTLRTGKFMVCETVQLAGGRVPQSEADACAHDASYATPSIGGGWCAARDATIVGPTCIAAGAPGSLRMFGMPQMNNALWFAPPAGP